MKTILILMLVGRSVTTAEFDDEAACSKAAAAVVKLYGQGYMMALCVPKGTTK